MLDDDFGNKQSESFELFFPLRCFLIEMSIRNMYIKPVESQGARIYYIYGARHTVC